ncbi:Acetoin dehydrogenase operon transcriptional activator AcoR [Pseudomonas fluorescens]|nr:Acetoin dehydrogenase operon transcriptional activator AcoR [Pseudomonas fluorescens]
MNAPHLNVVYPRPEQDGQILAAWEGVLSGVETPASILRYPVGDSWRRCLDKRVNPTLRHAPEPVTQAQLETIRGGHAHLLDVSAMAMVVANQFLAQTGTIIVLADSSGMIIETGGDPHTLRSAEHIHLLPGSPWGEDVCGTNAIGTALLLKGPVQVHAAEHFCEGIKQWTCSATVIRDPADGHILGVLNVSGESKTYNRHTLALAVSVADRIELALTNQNTANRYRLLDASVDQWREGGEGVMLFDANGFLVKANAQAHGAMAARGVDLSSTSTCRLPSLCLDDDGRLTGVLPQWLAEDWLQPVRARGLRLGTLVRIPGKSPVLPTIVHSVRHQAFETQRGFDRIIGESPALLESLNRARQLASSHVSVLLHGETGVGKEAFAQGIHYSGVSKDGPFVSINCGSLSKDLLSSELFGYADGAFTGARRGGMKGKIEAADRGTLFLDEIGEMPMDLQSYLLRVLEEGEIYRLGETEPRKVNFRLVAATNRDLREDVADQRFRSDLFYRIAVTSVTIPPLRERKEDIPRLVEHLLISRAQRHRVAVPKVEDDLLAHLVAYSWPGNVRELRNAIEGMLLMGGSTLSLSDLPSYIPKVDVVQSDKLVGSLKENECQLISVAIERCRGNLTQVAKELGIAKSTLYLRIKRYGIRRQV